MELTEASGGRLTLISGYGEGGFRIRGARHEGHLLVWPEGFSSWSARDPKTPLKTSFNALFSKDKNLEFLIIGVGVEAPDAVVLARRLAAELGLPVEVMTTGAAVRTYNVLALEGRRVGAALWAV